MGSGHCAGKDPTSSPRVDGSGDGRTPVNKWPRSCIVKSKMVRVVPCRKTPGSPVAAAPRPSEVQDSDDLANFISILEGGSLGSRSGPPSLFILGITIYPSTLRCLAAAFWLDDLAIDVVAAFMLQGNRDWHYVPINTIVSALATVESSSTALPCPVFICRLEQHVSDLFAT